MKIKLDENIPIVIGTFLRSRGHDVDTVRDEGLTGRNDDDVWSAAQADERFFITQDLDFSDIRKFGPGMHCGVLVARFIEPGAGNLAVRLHSLFKEFPIESFARCFVVLTENKIRIRRPE